MVNDMYDDIRTVALKFWLSTSILSTVGTVSRGKCTNKVAEMRSVEVDFPGHRPLYEVKSQLKAFSIDSIGTSLIYHYRSMDIWRRNLPSRFKVLLLVFP